MEVLQLGPFPPPYGGVEANLVAIRAHLEEKAVSNGVVNLTRNRRRSENNVFYPTTAFETAMLLLRTSAKILHLHIGGDVSVRLAALGLFCSLLPGRKTVLTLHSGGFPSSEVGRKASWWSFRGFAFRRFDRVVVVNDQLADVFRRYGVKSERIRLILPYAVSLEEMAPTLTDPMHGFFASHSPVLLSVGGLEPEYDVGLQIEVVERLRTRFPSVGLVMIGSGSLEEQLRARIEESSARDHLLLAGDVSHPQTLRAINESHVLLRTTWYDGDAISVREALFLQAPVIATDNGMRPPRVHLIPKQDADALENAIVGVLASDRKGGAQQELSGRENLDAVFELYRELAPISSAR